MATWKEKTKGWRTPSLVVTIGSMILGGLWGLSRQVTTHEVKSEQLQFQTVEQRVKVVEWAESDYNQVAVYEEGKKISKAYSLLDTLFKERIRDDSIKKIKDAIIEKSRASRDSSQRVQAQNDIIQNETMRLILEKLNRLDSIK